MLVGVCVCALLAVQIVWMKDALKLKEDQFNRNAETALSEFAYTFEEDIFCSELFTNIKLNSGDAARFVLGKWSDSSGVDIDPESEGLSFYYRDSEDKLNSYGDLKFRYPATVQVMLKINTWLDTNVVFDEGEFPETIESNRTDPEQFKRFVSAHHNPADLFGDGYIDTMLNDQLLARGIDLGFTYTVRDTSGNFIYGDEKQAGDQGGVAGLHEILLPNNDFFDPYVLHLNFPDKNFYLLRGSLVFLIVSFLIIVALVSSFYVFVRFLLRQVQLSQMKNNFVNNMTHEFKTPTTNISLALENIDMLNGQVNGRLQKYLKIINEENNRMITNVERILEVAKYSSREQVQLATEAQDIHGLIREVSERFKLKAEKIGGEFHCILNAQESTVYGDAHHIKNTISNVLDNALKYIEKEHPDVVLSTNDTEKGLEIAVKDNGIGLSQADIERIFDPFYRKDTGNIHNVKGFGLGLSYVKRVMEMHGGEVRVESKPGEGSTFKLYFPSILKPQA